MQVIEHHRRHTADAAHRPPGWMERWLHRPGTAALILAISLVLTALAWMAARHFALDEARQRFERHSDEVQAHIVRRMGSYEALLLGGAALFSASGDVSRDQWRNYASTVNPEMRFPGIQGFGFSRLVRPHDLPAHEAAVRAEGFPDYQVRPVGERDFYSAIVYLEPFVERNLRAFGFDMASEPTRREAMYRARDAGETALSGVVTLVQEDGRDVQKGFLMYVPVYRGGTVPVSVSARQERLVGWVYAPFRVKDLMQGILGADTGGVGIRIHDSQAQETDTAMYDSQDEHSLASASFERQVVQTFAGRKWILSFKGGDSESQADTWQSNLVAAAGLSIDLLLYWTITQLARGKRSVEAEIAVRIAEAERRTDWLDAVSDLSPNGVLVFDRDSEGLLRLVFTNPTFSQLFGMRPEDLLGLSEEAVNEWLTGLVGPQEEHLPLVNGEGNVVLAGPPVRMLERRVRDRGQQRVYYFRDTTRETEVDRLKSEFLTTAAHELRTPLASVYGFTELLMADKMSPEKRQRAIAIVYRQAGVLKNLVDELLDLARLDSKRGSDFHRTVFNLQHVVQEAVQSVLQPGRPPRVLTAPCDEPLWVNADKLKLRQVMLNLVSNAVKYSPDDTIVIARLAYVMQPDGPWARVTVVDQGIGMSEAQLARASERFFRADPSGHIPGTGLGLSIAKDIMALHEGRLSISSREGEGTQVSFELPLCDAPTGRTAPQGHPTAAAESETA